MEAIDESIPYYILYILEYQGNFELWLGYKEKSNSPNKLANIIRYFHSNWNKNPEITLIGNKIDSIYQGLLEQISDNRISTASGTDIKEQIVKITEIKNLEKQIEKLTSKMLAQKQFNRQVAIRNEIKQLQQKIKDLNNG